MIDSTSVAHVGYAVATLHAKINPNEVETTYHFEYGPTASYGTSVPIPDAPVGSGSEDVGVSQFIGGLQAGSSYRYRVVAVNAEGVTYGSDLVFHTYASPVNTVDSCLNSEIRGKQSSSYLPDCRAYELVSPPGNDKNGANVAAAPTKTRAASSGDAVEYESISGFGDTQGSEPLGFEYVSQRASDGSGWITHGINPEQNTRGPRIFSGSQYMAFSEDLSEGAYYAVTPILPGHPNTEKTDNLYLRTDVLAAPPGSYELLSDSIEPLPALSELALSNEETHFAAASANWHHILFESFHDLTPEAKTLDPKLPKVYEWHDGQVRLTGILPNEEPAPSSIAGRGTGIRGGTYIPAAWTTHTISSDGSRIVFTAPQSGPAGNLYMRIDGERTIQLNVSERSELDPNGEQPAEYAASTPDDSKVFFLSAQALTDNAPVGERALYMYDVNAPEHQHLTLISVDKEPAGEGDLADGVAAVSEDGEYIYFTGMNLLLPGQSEATGVGSGGDMLYVWHNGTLRIVATSPNINRWQNGVGWGKTTLGEGDTLRIDPSGKTALLLDSNPETSGAVGYDNISEGCEAPCSKDSGNQVCAEGGPGSGEPERCRELYLYDYDANKLVCVSCDSSGARPVSDAGINLGLYESSDISVASGVPSTYLNRPYSSNGRYVFFDTGDALVPSDTNDKRDVYEYEVATGEVHLISAGTCACESRFVDASPDGSNVFFVTHQQLVRADIDNSADMYDARTEGGIPSQNQPPSAPCIGEECQGPGLSAPVFSIPATATFVGTGNPASVSRPIPKSKHRSTPRRHKKKRRGKHKKTAKHASRRAGR